MYKKSYPGLGVRVYLLLYNNSFEEGKYLAGVRREKGSFERLIKERGVSGCPGYTNKDGGKEKQRALICVFSSSPCLCLYWRNDDQGTMIR